ncbi:MAG: flagellar hook-length control protein FliK [Acidobacteriota bacterium]|jgi:flagellar hook-length control protein FliK|nr:flagellar hook-length control protein FliK [Acidobacteriota bacterium]
MEIDFIAATDKGIDAAATGKASNRVEGGASHGAPSKFQEQMDRALRKDDRSRESGADAAGTPAGRTARGASGVRRGQAGTDARKGRGKAAEAPEAAPRMEDASGQAEGVAAPAVAADPGVAPEKSLTVAWSGGLAGAAAPVAPPPEGAAGAEARTPTAFSAQASGGFAAPPPSPAENGGTFQVPETEGADGSPSMMGPDGDASATAGFFDADAVAAAGSGTQGVAPKGGIPSDAAGKAAVAAPDDGMAATPEVAQAAAADVHEAAPQAAEGGGLQRRALSPEGDASGQTRGERAQATDRPAAQAVTEADAEAQADGAGRGGGRGRQGGASPASAPLAEQSGRLRTGVGGQDQAKDMASAAGAQSKVAMAASAPEAEAAARVDVRSREFVTQMAEHIRLQLRAGGGLIRIQLHPEDLGRVDIRAEQGREGITARITAESREAKALLENNLPSLQQALEERGLRVDRLHVVMREGADASGFAEDGSRSGQPWAGRRARQGGRGSAQGGGFDENFADGVVEEAAPVHRRGRGFHRVA